MSVIDGKVQIVYTNKAHCRDCHRCLRVCPVKAIRMENGQAYVVPELCISCGTCVRECPQGAKRYVREIDKVKGFMEAGDLVAASIAPSFAGIIKPSEWGRMAGALRRLGFCFVAETAAGAHVSALKTAELIAIEPDEPHICSACPAVVSYVEKYDPSKVSMLVRAASPMTAHARHIKAVLEGRQDIAERLVRVVFIGPCIAKKAEAQRPDNAGAVDAVLTFEELYEWFVEEGVALANCEEARFDERPEGDARKYPLLGGLLKAASLDTDVLSKQVVSASGFAEVKDLLEGASGAPSMIAEPLFCRQGCVNGPAIPECGSVHERRRKVLEYATSCAEREVMAGRNPAAVPGSWPGLTARFEAEPVAEEEIDEERIQQVFERTGKALPEDRLDCGACGYDSCRDKAVAVIRGYAEPEMCMPYVKRLAERRTDKIIESSPNGIVMLDADLRIISMNTAFKRLFMCGDSLCGKHISYLMDPDPFERVAAGVAGMISETALHPKYGLECLQITYSLPEDRQYVGIVVDTTKSQANKQKLDELRRLTVEQARQLMEHQIRIAQTMARLIGESTAQGEALVEKLVELAEEGNADDGGVAWLTDTYTMK